MKFISLVLATRRSDWYGYRVSFLTDIEVAAIVYLRDGHPLARLTKIVKKPVTDADLPF